MRSCQGSDARPLTCAQPVMPGRTASRPRWRSEYWSTWTCTVGRGPTSDISPASTLIRFGQLVDRVAAQPGADAGDARVAGLDDQAVPMRSASVTIVRSL